MMMSILQQQARRTLANRSCLFRRSYNTLFGTVKTDLENWRKQQGAQVKPSYVRGLINNLRDTNEFSKALEASEWMCEQKFFNVFPDYAARLHLVETVLGLEEAEKFFESIPENMKDYSVYNTLLRSYTRSEKTLDKAESTFEKMRDLGFLLNKTSPLNSMISLYSHLDKQDMVDKIQRELEETESDDEKGTELERDRIDAMVKDYVNSGSMEKALIEMYGDVPGSTTEVYRLWNEYKRKGNKSNDGYRSVIKALLKLDDVQGAELIYEEWKWVYLGDEIDMSIPDLLISRFRAEGNDSKVEEMFKFIRIRKKILTPLRRMIGYLIILGIYIGVCAVPTPIIAWSLILGLLYFV